MKEALLKILRSGIREVFLHPCADIGMYGVYIATDNGTTEIKSTEIIGGENEVYSLVAKENAVYPTEGRALPLSGPIKRIDILSRDEWFERNEADKKKYGLIGENPRTQCWGKVGARKDVIVAGTSMCGVTFHFSSQNSLMVFLSDYPELVDVTMLKDQISEMSEQFTLEEVSA